MTIRRLFVSAAVVLMAASAAAVDVRKPDATATTGRPDLIASDLRIDADGKMAFKIRNASPVAINTPFKVDAWLDGYLRQTIQIGGLKSVPVGGTRIFPTTLPFGPNEQRDFILQEVKVDLCSSNHSLKVLVDSGGEIAESNENNNTLTWSGPTPCPDLAIKSISKHWQNSMHTEFTAEIVIINQGTGNAGPFGVATGGSSATGIPSGAPMMYDGLKAGETLTLHAGNAYVPDGISVHVVVDIGNAIKESNENNNVADKSIH
jgi:CARDB